MGGAPYRPGQPMRAPPTGGASSLETRTQGREVQDADGGWGAWPTSNGSTHPPPSRPPRARRTGARHAGLGGRFRPVARSAFNAVENQQPDVFAAIMRLGKASHGHAGPVVTRHHAFDLDELRRKLGRSATNVRLLAAHDLTRRGSSCQYA